MTRVTVTSGGGSARYGSKCQTCGGYGDIQKLRSRWMCLPCRVNNTAIYAAEQTLANCVGTDSGKARRAIERKKAAEQEIKDRRAGITPPVKQSRSVNRVERPFRRTADSTVPLSRKARAARKSVSEKAAAHRDGTVLSNPAVATAPELERPGRRAEDARPAPESFETARTRLQQKWNSRLS